MKLYLILQVLLLFTATSYGISLKIDDCRFQRPIEFTTDENRTVVLAGNLTINLNGVDLFHDAATIDDSYFQGVLTIGQDIVNTSIDIKFNALKSVRVQRLIFYYHEKFMDRSKSRCIVSFSYNDESRIALPRYVEDRITSLAESCIEQLFCSFRPNQKQIGDNIQVEPVAWKNRTSQDTINSLTDDLLSMGMSVLSKANKTTFRIPPIDLDKSTFLYSIYFKTSGGLVDVVEYIKRSGDIKLTYFDRKYVIELGLDVVGGGINLEDLRLKVPVIFNEINGRIYANLTGSSARMRLALDYQATPCRLVIEDLAIHLPERVLDFSQLGSSLLVRGIEAFGGKPVILSILIDQVRNAVGNIVLDVDCEKFRRDIFHGYPYER